MTIQTSHGIVPTWTRGDRLRKAREVTGLTTREFAREIGVSQTTVTNAENDRTQVRRITMMAYAMRSGVSLTWLETGKAPDHHDPGLSYTTRDSNPEPADIHERRQPLEIVALLSRAS